MKAKKLIKGTYFMLKRFTKYDKNEYFELTKLFYQSDAVLHPVPHSHLESTFTELINGSPFLDGCKIMHNGTTAGFALFAITYSQEAGGKVLWLEELYIKEEFRSLGLGSKFFEEILKKLPSDFKRIRLEVEDDNLGAIRFYKRFGFDWLDYKQMNIDFK